MSAELPKLLKDSFFEDYVSAYFQCQKLYIEKSVIQRESSEVLELDVITTSYVNDVPEFSLIEAKSGKHWGFETIFKIRGWMDYLNIDKSYLCVSKAKPNGEMKFYMKKSIDIGVSLLLVENPEKNQSILNNEFDHDGEHVVYDDDILIWRFSNWLERKIIKELKNRKKLNISDKYIMRYKVMDEYHHKVTSSVFFESSPIKKLFELYSIYKDYPNLSAKCSNEIVGDDFEEDGSFIDNNIFKDTFYNSKFTDIQISTYIEFRSRLEILKNTVDYILLKKQKMNRKEKKKFGLMYEKALLNLLPHTFSSGLKELEEHEHIKYYPVIWQWFLWALGGFILMDYKDVDYDHLSQASGAPVECIPDALRAFDLLFPISGGWFNKPTNNSKIKSLKLFPVPFKGIGANYRRINYTDEELQEPDFDDLDLTGEHTLNDLIAWNNLAVDILSGK